MVAHQIWLRVQQGERPPVTAADEAGAPEGYVTLMREMWAQDPVTRPTFAEALRRLKSMLTEAPPASRNIPSGVGLDLVSDLFEEGGGGEGPGNGSNEEEAAMRLRSLQYLGSTPTAGDYARTLGHASFVDMMMGGGGGAAGRERELSSFVTD